MNWRRRLIPVADAKPGVSMDWRQRLLDHAATLGRDVYDSPLGVGIDFGDGCDAFWVLPGEVTSTVPAPAAIRYGPPPRRGAADAVTMPSCT